LELGFILLNKIIAMGINRDDQRAKYLDAVNPQGFRHPEVLPFSTFNFLDLSGCQYRTSSRENRMNCFVFLTACDSLRAMPPLPTISFTPVCLINSRSNFSIRILVVGPIETIGVAVNTGCWAHRRGKIKINPDMSYEILSHEGVVL
jgi:hypothetical protein